MVSLLARVTAASTIQAARALSAPFIISTNALTISQFRKTVETADGKERKKVTAKAMAHMGSVSRSCWESPWGWSGSELPGIHF